MLGGAESFGDTPGRVKLYTMPLAIVERHSIAIEPFAASICEAGGGIKSAAQKTNCGSHFGSLNVRKIPITGNASSENRAR